MTGVKITFGGETARVAAYAAAFFLITSLSIFHTRFGAGIALVWPGTAILVALLVEMPRRRWPAIAALFAVLSALATSLFGFGPRIAAPLALVNVFEGLVIAGLLLALRPRRDWLERVEGLAALIAVGGIVGPALAAIPGGLLVTLFMGGSWTGHALHWLPAHGLGTLLAFPLFSLAQGFAWGGWSIRIDSRKLVVLAAHLTAIAAIAALVLFQSTYPLLFLPVAPLLYAALRLGRLGAALGIIVIAAIAAESLHLQAGFLQALPLPLPHTVLFVQFYLAVLLLLALPVSVALKQHELLMAELDERRAMKRLIADHSDDALLNLDELGIIRYASPAGTRLSGHESLTGQPFGLFFEPLDELLVRNTLALAAAAPGKTCVLERAVVRGDEQVWLEAKLRAITPENRPRERRGYVVTIRDVTARKQGELDAIQAAETDPLTGLPNRRALLRHLERALAHAAQRPFAIAILDLDLFKQVNDTHGHLAGDTVLREVAAVMRRLDRPSRFFARLGGEEFAVIAREGRFEDSQALCEELRAAIAALPFSGPDTRRFHVTASIGLLQIATAGTAAQALQGADALLYQAKKSGRNRVVSGAPAPTPRANRRAA